MSVVSFPRPRRVPDIIVDDLLFDDFAVRRAVLDNPLSDEELAIPPHDSLNPFGSRAVYSPDRERVGASRFSIVARPRLFRDALEIMLGALAYAFAIGLIVALLLSL